MQANMLATNSAYLLLFTLSLLWILLGSYWGKKAIDLEGFTLANRNLGLSLGTISILATWITSNTTMLAPQFAYEMGIWGILSYVMFAAGLFAFAPLARRIQDLMPHGNTCGDFFRIRYGQKAWKAFLIVTLFYSLTWLVSMGMAGGLLLELLSGIPYWQGLSIIITLCTVYTLRGGLYAVVGTDAIQCLILLVGVIALGVMGLERINVSEAYSSIVSSNPSLMNVLVPSAVIAFFNTFLFGVGEIFHGNIWWTRVFAIRKGNAGSAFLLAGLLWIPVPIIMGYLALLAFPLGIEIPRADLVGPLVAIELVGQTGAVIVFVVIFCSLVSSTDSLLSATADLLSNDLLKFRFGQNEKRVLFLNKLSIIFLGLLTWLIALPKVGTLATVLFLAGPMVGSTIAPVLYGLFSARATNSGAFYALTLGSTLGLISYVCIGWTTGAITGTLVSGACMFFSTSRSVESFDWKNVKEGRSK